MLLRSPTVRKIVLFLVVVALVLVAASFLNSPYRAWMRYNFSNPTASGWFQDAPGYHFTILADLWQIAKVMLTFGDISMAAALWILVIGVVIFKR